MVCLSFFTFCKKNNCKQVVNTPATPVFFPGSLDDGWCSSLKNEREFLGSAFGQAVDSVFFLSFYTVNQINYFREQGYLSFIPLKIGKYRLLEYPAITGQFETLAADGDILADAYDLLKNEDGFIEITQLDTIQGKVVGKFSATFTYKGPYPKFYADHPDTFHFTNALFEINIQ